MAFGIWSSLFLLLQCPTIALTLALPSFSTTSPSIEIPATRINSTEFPAFPLSSGTPSLSVPINFPIPSTPYSLAFHTPANAQTIAGDYISYTLLGTSMRLMTYTFSHPNANTTPISGNDNPYRSGSPTDGCYISVEQYPATGTALTYGTVSRVFSALEAFFEHPGRAHEWQFYVQEAGRNIGYGVVQGRDHPTAQS